MKNILSSIIRWIIVNGFIAACFFYGITRHNGLADLAQILTLIFLFYLILITALVFRDDEKGADARNALRPAMKEWHMPKLINLFYDLSLSVFLAYNNYICTAVATLLLYLFQRLLTEQIKDTEQKDSPALVEPITPLQPKSD